MESDLPETKILFWAHQFGFKNGPGGYIGLQTVEGKTKAIFSIWDALSGSNGCDTFSGEGTGIRCLIDYDWKVGEFIGLEYGQSQQVILGLVQFMITQQIRR